MADPRGDQRSRDRLRLRPVGVERRRGGLDAVRALDLAAVRGGRARRGLRRPIQPGGRDLRRRALSARGRRLQEPAHSDPRLQPFRSVCRIGAAARQTDLQLPQVGDRDADGPRRCAPAGDRQAGVLGRCCSPLRRRRPRARPRTRRPSRARPRPRRARRHDGSAAQAQRRLGGRRIDAGLGAGSRAAGAARGHGPLLARRRRRRGATEAAPEFVEL